MGADLRGADLRGADLEGADLRGIRTGPSSARTALLVAGALTVSVATGVLAGLGGRYLTQLLRGDAPTDQVLSILVTSVLVVFVLATIVIGLGRALRVVVPVLAATFTVAWIVTVASDVGTGRMALAALGFVAAITLVVVLAISTRVLAGGVRALEFLLVAVSGALAGALLGGGVAATVVALGTVVAAQRSLHGAPGYPWLVETVATLHTRAGTNFRDANLTGARLEGTTLRACDLRGAKLEGAHLEGARWLACRFDGEPPRLPRSRPSLAERTRAATHRLWHSRAKA